MCNETITGQIRRRINELKSEQILLKPFIQSDQILWEALERAIVELNWVLNRMELEGGLECGE